MSAEFEIRLIVIFTTIKLIKKKGVLKSCLVN